jgi:hypothetical protein
VLAHLVSLQIVAREQVVVIIQLILAELESRSNIGVGPMRPQLALPA